MMKTSGAPLRFPVIFKKIFPLKERLHTKQEKNRKKVHNFYSTLSQIEKTSIFHHKYANIRNKCFTFAIDKTQLSFFFSRVAASI